MRIIPWLVALSLFSLPIGAIPTVVPDPVPCVLELETHFFVEPIVNQGLSLYNVRQELWLLINQRLQQKNGLVPERMKRRTAFMVPNPIEYPMQPMMTAKILKEVLYELFLEALNEYNVGDQPRAGLIVNYIFAQQFPSFIRCFGPEVKKLQPKFD
jgi:hypothetical protein